MDISFSNVTILLMAIADNEVIGSWFCHQHQEWEKVVANPGVGAAIGVMGFIETGGRLEAIFIGYDGKNYYNLTDI